MQNRYLYLFRLMLACVDFAVVNLALLTAFSYADPPVSSIASRDFIIISNLVWLTSTQIFQLYHKKNLPNRLFNSASIKCFCLHFILLMLYVSTPPVPVVTGSFMTFSYSVLGLMLLLSRIVSWGTESILQKKFREAKPVAFIGVNPTTLQLAHYFKRQNKQYSFYGDDHAEAIEDQMKLAAEAGANEVYVSLAPEKIAEANMLVKEADRQCVRLKFLPDFSQSMNEPFRINYVGNFPVLTLTTEPLEEMSNRFVKRLFDITFSLFVIVFILSWLFPIIALAIKLESRGPVIFRQLRSGRDNVPFWCYKFRSMQPNKDSDQLQASKGDSRITRVGRFLRKTSLDEFPQFFNVLQGNMSIVGPRPHMLKHTEQYRDLVNRYMVRHYLKPGITGWAQIHGLRGETSQIDQMEKRVKHDIWYLENWSAYLDLKIVFLTAVNVIRGEENAY